MDKETNDDVVRKVNEDKQTLNDGSHFWRHNGLLHGIIEGRMKGKPVS